MHNTKVIAVSGASGAGKTTIVKRLAEQFDCPYLLFDEHTDNNTYPNDMKLWLKNGADVNRINTPKLVAALTELISKNSSGFIFIEEPFGKEREVLSSLIDYVVLLDTPLELCLARIIERHTRNANANSVANIASYLHKYHDHYRDIYLTTTHQVRQNADCVVTEVLSIKATTDLIGNWLKIIAN